MKSFLTDEKVVENLEFMEKFSSIFLFRPQMMHLGSKKSENKPLRENH